MARQLHGEITRLPVVLRGDDPRQRDSRGTIAGWSDSGEALASPSVSRHPVPNTVFSQSRNGRGRDGRSWFWRPPVVAEGRLFVANRQSMVVPAALRSSS